MTELTIPTSQKLAKAKRFTVDEAAAYVKAWNVPGTWAKVCNLRSEKGAWLVTVYKHNRYMGESFVGYVVGI